MTSCNIFGHHYEPRYDEIPLDISIKSIKAQSVYDPDSIRSLFVREVYIKDICRRCGDVIKRGSND